MGHNLAIVITLPQMRKCNHINLQMRNKTINTHTAHILDRRSQHVSKWITVFKPCSSSMPADWSNIHCSTEKLQIFAFRIMLPRSIESTEGQWYRCRISHRICTWFVVLCFNEGISSAISEYEWYICQYSSGFFPWNWGNRNAPVPGKSASMVWLHL